MAREKITKKGNALGSSPDIRGLDVVMRNK
jgi:hypothetical protein